MQNQKDNHYNISYDTIFRFVSYFYQIDSVSRLNPGNILEIGVGNGTVANYLKQNGFGVKTCDIDPDLKPDYVADIRKLPLRDNDFDLVLACEILEHIPFEDVGAALEELRRVAKKHVVISLPYTSPYFECITKFTGLNRLFGKDFLHFIFRIPFLQPKYSPEHYWEMDGKNYPASKIRNLFKGKFKIIREVSPILVRHYFFVLEKC